MDFVDFMALLMGIFMFHQWTRTIYLIDSDFTGRGCHHGIMSVLPR
jgi:hypothetical protein